MEPEAVGQWAVIQDATTWEAFIVMVQANMGARCEFKRTEPKEFPCLVGVTWVRGTGKRAKSAAHPAFVYLSDCRRLISAQAPPAILRISPPPKE